MNSADIRTIDHASTAGRVFREAGIICDACGHCVHYEHENNRSAFIGRPHKGCLGTWRLMLMDVNVSG